VILGFLLSLRISSSISKELRGILSNLVGNADEVSSTVSDLSSSSDGLSSSVSNQASAIQETAASIEEIRAMVQKNSDNSSESATISARSKDEAKMGKKSVDDVIHAVQEIDSSNKMIQNEVQSGNKRILEIVDIIREIEVKTKVINEIVFQTKLLSFNASVEAARAGEHGKGFSVVAEEIGNLASMSGSAASEITNLLSESTSKVDNIVSTTTQNVEALMKEVAEKVLRGSRLAIGCGEVLDKIVANADHLSTMVESISSASREQATGVNEIARAIQLLETSAQESSIETQNIYGTSSRLADQTKSLNLSSHRLLVLVEGGTNNSKTYVNSFVWKDRYSLGVEKMDDEHKILIEKINNLVLGINKGSQKSTIKRLFVDLAEYTKSHFADEEAYMASISYPDLRQHQEIHKRLLNQVTEFEGQIERSDFEPTTLISFLNDWLIKHILAVDMRYADFSRSSELEGRKAS